MIYEYFSNNSTKNGSGIWYRSLVYDNSDEYRFTNDDSLRIEEDGKIIVAFCL